MKRRYCIEVTQEDVDEGERFEPRWCAVARAVKRVAGTDLVDVCGSDDIRIAGKRFRVANRSRWVGFNQFLVDFDSARSPSPPKPFAIEEF